MMPKVMCTTPITIDDFILKEFRKLTEFVLSCQVQSKPKPHWQSSDIFSSVRDDTETFIDR